MDKNSRDKRFIRKPIFRGGNKEFSKFLYSNLKYPKAALDQKIEGTVIIRYEIDHKGDVVKTKILSSLGHGCDEEAARVVKLLKFDIPKGPRKLKVKFHRTTKVKFVMPKKKMVKPTPTPSPIPEAKLANKGKSINYLYTKKPVLIDEVQKKNAPKTYSYNVSW